VRRAASGAAWALAALSLAAFLVRLLLRDRAAFLAPLFYATPPMVLAGLLAGAALLWGRGARARRAAGFAAVALLWSLGMHRYPGIRGEAGLRVVLWNVGGGHWDEGEVARALREEDSDVALVAEAPAARVRAARFLEAAFAGRTTRRLPGDMVLAVRGRILDVRSHPLGDRDGDASVVRVEVGTRALTVVAVDLSSDPFYSRAPAFRALGALLEACGPGPLLVLGDFNTPRDSVHFDAWRCRLVHAFEAAGGGSGATWPWPVPLLSIDHVWAGSPLRVLSCEIAGSRASDHRRVRVGLGP
jgi:endonuclease/exonuclease/phosphatase family metal-dependent hydrolase